MPLVGVRDMLPPRRPDIHPRCPRPALPPRSPRRCASWCGWARRPSSPSCWTSASSTGEGGLAGNTRTASVALADAALHRCVSTASGLLALPWPPVPCSLPCPCSLTPAHSLTHPPRSDPHPGNLLKVTEGPHAGKLALLDFGLVSEGSGLHSRARVACHAFRQLRLRLQGNWWARFTACLPACCALSSAALLTPSGVVLCSLLKIQQVAEIPPADREAMVSATIHLANRGELQPAAQLLHASWRAGGGSWCWLAKIGLLGRHVRGCHPRSCTAALWQPLFAHAETHLCV